MSEKLAQIAANSGNGGTIAAFFVGLGVYTSDGITWLNENYMAVLALCAIVTCIVGVYGTRERIKIARQQKRRSTDEES